MSSYTREQLYCPDGFYALGKTYTDRYQKLMDLLDGQGWVPPEGGVIVDAGCCTGVTSAELAIAYKAREVTVFGCDLNIKPRPGTPPNDVPSREKYLAEKHAVPEDLEGRLLLSQASYIQLPLPTNSADLVIYSNNVSQDIAEERFIEHDGTLSPHIVYARLGEGFRVLKENGLMLIWTETHMYTTILIRKVGGRAVAALEPKSYARYLGQVYRGKFFHNDIKLADDLAATKAFVDALNCQLET